MLYVIFSELQQKDILSYHTIRKYKRYFLLSLASVVMILYLGIYQQCLIFGLFPDYLTFIRRLRSAVVSSHPKSEFRL